MAQAGTVLERMFGCRSAALQRHPEVQYHCVTPLVEVTAHGVIPAVAGGVFPRVNHFVIGVPVGGRSTLPNGTAVGESASASSAVTSGDSLRVMSLRAGLAVLHTQAAGDCGIDAMSYYTALPRTASSFKAVRKSLADFMVSVAAKPEWQRIFGTCQEYDQAYGEHVGLKHFQQPYSSVST